MKKDRRITSSFQNVCAKVFVFGGSAVMYHMTEKRAFEHAPRPFDIAEHGHHPLPYALLAYFTTEQLEAHTKLDRKRSAICTIGFYTLVASLYETKLNPIPNTRDWVDIVYSALGASLGAAIVTPYRPIELSDFEQTT